MLYRRRDIKRLFAYSSIEHMGIITFAFGMGGPLANFAGLLHMTMHSLTKSAIFFAVGHIAQVKGTQKIARHPRADRQPSGARLGARARRARHRRPAAARHLHERVPGRQLDVRARSRLLALPLVLGILRRLRRPDAAADTASRSASRRGQHGAGRGLLRADVRASGPGAGRRHLSAGAAGRLVPACRHAAWVRGRGRWARSPDLPDRGRAVVSSSIAPWPRTVVDAEDWNVAGSELAEALAAARPVGRAGGGPHGAARRARPARSPSSACDARTAASPRSRARIRRRCRLERAIGDLFGLIADDAPDPRPWLDHGAWGVRHPLGDRTSTQRRGRCPTRFLPAKGESLHQIPVGPVHAGIIEPGHFRFTASGETVVRLEQRLGYVHKGIEGLMAGADLAAPPSLPARVSGDSTVAYALAFAQRRRSGARDRVAGRARSGCGAAWPSWSGSPIISATSARSATTPRSR